MMGIANSVMVRGKPRFSISGQRLPDNLHDTSEEISAGLVKRLHKYALSAMTNAGFMVDGWGCEVYTLDGDLPPSNRSYCVEFTNSHGGMIGLQGILTDHGWPILDHGLTVACRRKPHDASEPAKNEDTRAHG